MAGKGSYPFPNHPASSNRWVVPSVGVEPTCPCGHLILSQARLPVSPRGVVSPRLILGDGADVSALFQSEEVFSILDVANKLIKNLDVLVKNISDDLREVVGLFAVELLAQQLHAADDQLFCLAVDFHWCLFSMW